MPLGALGARELVNVIEPRAPNRRGVRAPRRVDRDDPVVAVGGQPLTGPLSSNGSAPAAGRRAPRNRSSPGAEPRACRHYAVRGQGKRGHCHCLPRTGFLRTGCAHLNAVLPRSLGTLGVVPPAHPQWSCVMVRTLETVRPLSGPTTIVSMPPEREPFKMGRLDHVHVQKGPTGRPSAWYRAPPSIRAGGAIRTSGRLVSRADRSRSQQTAVGPRSRCSKQPRCTR